MCVDYHGCGGLDRVGMEVMVGMHSGQSQRVGRMSGDTEAFPV